MRIAVQWIRSAVFVVQVYAAMALVALAMLPWAVLKRGGTYDMGHAWVRWVRFSARWIVGLRTEIRGTPPQDAVLVAAKHQSFLDIILLFGAMPRGRFIMKREILAIPILGQFARAIGCVPVDRGTRGGAVRKMLERVDDGRREPGQLIIYPQGTRVAPGVRVDYKVGAALLYAQLRQPCVPVAVNVGLFWPRRGILIRPGTAIVEFLPRIPPGLAIDTFRARLTEEVEAGSDRLLAEAGYILRGDAPA